MTSVHMTAKGQGAGGRGQGALEKQSPGSLAPRPSPLVASQEQP